MGAAPSTSASSTPGRVGRGAGAIALLVVLVGGLPLALVLVAGSPLPTSLPTWAEIQSTLSHPDATGAVLLGVIRGVAWIAWATFAAAVVLEFGAALGGARAPRVRGLGVQQRIAAALVGAAVALVVVAPGAASATAHPSLPGVSATVDTGAQGDRPPATHGPTGSRADPPGAAGARGVGGAVREWSVGSVRTEGAVDGDADAPGATLMTYTVRVGDSLWGIAESTLGDGTLFKQIAELNYGVRQADGLALDASHWIEPGWVLVLPIPAEVEADAAATGAATGRPNEDDDTVAAPGPRPSTHTVEPGESLYSIAAERLGDGARYTEILDASRAVDQPDGGRITDPDLIRPGWTVVVPALVDGGPSADAGVPPPPGPPGTPGPAGARDADGGAPGVAGPEPSAVTGPEPSAVTGPEPPAVTGPEGGRQEGAGSEDAQSKEVAPEAARAAAPTTEGARGDGRDPASDDRQGVGNSGPPESSRATAAAVGGVLAAGLVGLLSARRIVERRRRRAGERVAVPDSTSRTGRFEARLRAVADPLGRDAVDRLLRSLAAWARAENRPLPDVRAARLAQGRYLEIYLDAPSMLPEPWTSTSDRLAWRFTAVDAAHLDLRLAATGEAPYPSLVTVGDDADGAHLMVDLERLGCLDIRGDARAGRAMLAALAIELATSPWADDLQVTLVGTHADMPEIVDTGRVRHAGDLQVVLRELEARAVDVEATLRRLGATSVADARGRGLMNDAWTPEILLIGEPVGPLARGALDRLVARVPGVGIAAVTNGSDTGEWAVHLTDGDPLVGLLLPVGIAIRPQQVPDADYVEALRLLRPAAPVPGPSWGRTLAAVDEVPLAAIPVVDVPPGSDDPTSIDVSCDRPLGVDVSSRPGSAAPEETPYPAESGVRADPSTLVGGAQVDLESDPLGIGPLDLGPLEPLDFGSWNDTVLGLDETLVDTPDDPDPDLDETLPAPPEDVGTDTKVVAPAARVRASRPPTTSPRPPTTSPPPPTTSPRPPIVRVLGSVDLEVTSGLAMPPSHRRQATELVAYLAFHPGASGADISAALWPTREPNLATRRSAISRARRWLGADGDGREYLPRYWSAADERPGTSDGTGYRLRGVSTDWQEFLRIVGSDVTTTPLSRLRDALALVRGPVFHKVPPRKYVWAEPLFQDMTAGVVDVAHEVARRALLAGDVATARHASQVGRLVDPADERVWRDGIRAEWAGGRAEGINRLVEQLRGHLESLELDPDPETEDLVSEVEGLTTSRFRERGRAGPDA